MKRREKRERERAPPRRCAVGGVACAHAVSPHVPSCAPTRARPSSLERKGERECVRVVRCGVAWARGAAALLEREERAGGGANPVSLALGFHIFFTHPRPPRSAHPRPLPSPPAWPAGPPLSSPPVKGQWEREVRERTKEERRVVGRTNSVFLFTWPKQISRSFRLSSASAWAAATAASTRAAMAASSAAGAVWRREE